jgi:hypothetical protein
VSNSFVLWSFLLSDVVIAMCCFLISTRLLWLLVSKRISMRAFFFTAFLFTYLCGLAHLLRAVQDLAPNFTLGAAVNVAAALTGIVVTVVIVAYQIDRSFLTEEMTHRADCDACLFGDMQQMDKFSAALSRSTESRAKTMLKKKEIKAA